MKAKYLWRPLFEFMLDVWLFRIYTALWRDRMEADCRDYVMVFFEVLGKERFRFRLYQTSERIYELGSPLR